MLVIAIIGAIVVAILAVLAVLRWRAEAQARIRSQRKRAPDLEARIKTVLAGPKQKYGDIFTDYSVWKSEQETRLELTATDQWGRLNEFTRCLVVRYLWRVLEVLKGSSPQRARAAVPVRQMARGFGLPAGNCDDFGPITTAY